MFYGLAALKIEFLSRTSCYLCNNNPGLFNMTLKLVVRVSQSLLQIWTVYN